MKAASRLVATRSNDGTTRLDVIRSEAPLLWRVTTGVVYLVGGAAGPIGGDELSIAIEVGPGAVLTIGSTAASVALPGPNGDTSHLQIDVSVGAGGALRWLPEPTVASLGCRHQVSATIAMETRSRLTWREELIAGRHGEESGSLTSALRVDLEGRPLVRQGQSVGPDAAGWNSPAVVGGNRAIGSLLLVDPSWATGQPPANLIAPTAAVFPLAGPGAMVTALANGATDLRTLLDAEFSYRGSTPGA